MKILRKVIMITCFALFAAGTIIGASGEEEPKDVYVIELHGEVNAAMSSYLERELKVAEERELNAILDIDTFGGLVISTDEMINVLLNSPVETTAYVSGKAISAGVLITMACDNVAMADSAYIGAVEPRPFDEKILSVVKGMLSTVADQNGRPEDVLHAMADTRIVIEGYSEEGQLLTLSSRQALDLGISDVNCNSLQEVMDTFSEGQSYEIAPRSLSDQTASLLANTTTRTVLFTLGFLFMIIEIYTAGFGVAGVIAIISFVLYFFGGMLAGTAQWWAMGLFVLGAVALLIEMFIPGFGVFGIVGLVMSFLGLLFSANSVEDFIKRFAIAIAACAVLIFIFVKTKLFKKIKLFDRLANKETQTVQEGYVINKFGEEMIGQEAEAITDLRPIGIIEANDSRIDAFSDEGFIEKGETVVITGKKSSSVIVRRKKT